MHGQDRALDIADSQRQRSAQANDLRPTALQAAVGRRGTMGGCRVLDLQRIIGNSAVAAALQDDEQSPVHEVIGSGGGRPLEPEVRADMKARLGHDFSHVRVHDDSLAHEAATAVNAHACTVGSEIVFQRGGYNPATPEGKLTLAHELTHVVQQSQGPVDGTEVPGGIRISDPGDRFEREAAANAERVVSAAAPAAPSAAGSVADVQRDPISRWHACVPARQAAPLDQAAASALQRLVGNRGVSTLLGGTLQRQVAPPSGTPPAADVRPTYGNLPREVPEVNVQRVELRIIKGKWRQVYPNGKWHSASGKYVFVIQDGKIYAQHAPRPGVGHTEVARGERVSWAGEVDISGNSGQVTSWNDGSGHYRPASSLRETAVRAGLPEDRFQQHPETAVRPRSPDTMPQLPVDQPRTRSITGDPPVVGPGPPRIEEMERDLRAGRTQRPAGSTPSATTASTATPAPKAATAPSKGEANVDRVSFAYDTEAADASKKVQLRGINLEDYPVERPGPVTRFFQDRPVLKKAAGAGVSVGAGVVTDVALSAIEGHFARAADRAATDVVNTFPTTEQILLDYKISERRAAYDAVMKGMSKDRSRAAVDAGMSDAFEYQDALDDVIGLLDRSQSQARDIVSDLSVRSYMLNQVGQDFEKTFSWIQQHVPVLWVYYQSFTLWHARDIFLGLSARLDHVIALLNQRISAYQDLYETLSSRLGVVDEDIGAFRAYADRVTKATPNR